MKKTGLLAKTCAAACLAVAMLHLPSAAEAAPGWCANVHSGSPDAEWAICDSQTLGNLDDAMTTAYRRARFDSPHYRNQIKRNQKRWLKRRNRCGGNFGCLRSTYQQRIFELEGYFAN